MINVWQEVNHDRTSFLAASSASFFSLASRCSRIVYNEVLIPESLGTNLSLFLLQFRASLTFLNYPFFNFFDALIRSSFVLEKVALKSSHLELGRKVFNIRTKSPCCTHTQFILRNSISKLLGKNRNFVFGK